MNSAKHKVKIVVLCTSGHLQNIMINTLCRDHEVVGVVLLQATTLAQTFSQKIKNLLGYLRPQHGYRYLAARVNLPLFEREAERRLIAAYPNYKRWQTLPVKLNSIQVSDINAPVVTQFIDDHKPDAVCVNGTNLIREPLLSKGAALRYGMINLHTGLSPYSRGGNCNLFMLLEAKPELVGGTIHYIDRGIDSGDIITTFKPSMQADDPFELIDTKVFLDGFELLSKALSCVAEAAAPRVKQWESGKLFLRRTGYLYQPYQRLLVNKMIQNGLLKDYLVNQEQRDEMVKLITLH